MYYSPPQYTTFLGVYSGNAAAAEPSAELSASAILRYVNTAKDFLGGAQRNRTR